MALLEAWMDPPNTAKVGSSLDFWLKRLMALRAPVSTSCDHHDRGFDKKCPTKPIRARSDPSLGDRYPEKRSANVSTIVFVRNKRPS